MNVPAEAIELGNRDRASPVPAGLGERDGELRPALDRVRALASLDLDKFADDLVILGSGETDDGRALGLDWRRALSGQGKRSGMCNAPRVTSNRHPRNPQGLPLRF